MNEVTEKELTNNIPQGGSEISLPPAPSQ